MIESAPAHAEECVTSKPVKSQSDIRDLARQNIHALHIHLTDSESVNDIMGFSAATSFLTRCQSPFMLVDLAMNLIGIGVMLFVISRERQKLQHILETI
jgi:hypothetical protein